MSSVAGTLKIKNPASTVIISDLAAVDVVQVGPVSVAKSGRYGINGGYFEPDSKKKTYGKLFSITYSMNQKAKKVVQQPIKRGTMICYRDICSNKLKMFTGLLGEYSLHLNSCKVEYLSKIKKETSASIQVREGDCRHQSAIGFRELDRKIVLDSFRKASPSEVRDIIKKRYHCDIAIMLDGGGSSQISGVGPKNKRIDTDFTRGVGLKAKDLAKSRKISSMIAVSPSKWIDV
ncbi:hypothetical protein K7432_016932 [Basidiobolus ranarum]|uniref:Phosphodiester glycosidase domain-containing protein n=1 Tax=Basidiobolus ranarum TaxID=34480 RepID=A0ABR2VM18_9FUNG